ncbi:MAG: xanthine dehydrogenase family protein molybdopterin-binding subunit [Halanaerobiales bacterium]
MSELKYVGQNITFSDMEDKVTGKIKYVGDNSSSDLLYTKLVLSEVARGEIVNIDTKKAKEVDGVVKIYTAENTPEKKYNAFHWYKGKESLEDERVLSEEARYYGDRIAAVVAEDREAAEKAAKLIEVEYNELEPYIDPERVREERVKINVLDNPFAEFEFSYGETDKVMGESANIFTDRVETPMVHHAAMENHACLAYPSVDGRLTVLSPCQLLYAVRLVVSEVLGRKLNEIRVIKTNMGGSFGAKQETFLEPLVAYIASDLGRPVLLKFNRKENILSTRVRSNTVGEVKTAVSDDGRILARDIDILVDAGAYTSNGKILIPAMGKKVSRLYKIPHQRFKGEAVHTNTLIGGPCRGFGSPQIHTLTELNIDRVAKKMGIDRVEFRLKNLVDPYEQDPMGGPELGNARIKEAVIEGARAFKWKQKSSTVNKEGRFKKGIGLACVTHVNGYFGAYQDFSGVNMRIYEDGSILIDAALHDLGTGVKTTMAQIAGEVLDVNPAKITVLEGDTDRSPYDIGCQASRSTFVMGRAVKETAEKLKKLLIDETKKLMGTGNDTEVSLDDGKVYINGEEKSLQEIAMRIQRENQSELFVNHLFQSKGNPGSYGVHFAEVDVDTYTGLVEVTEYVASHDVGKAINPSSVKNQIYGGVQMGIGMALMEEIKYDDQGIPQNPSFSKYHLVNAPDMPDVEIVLIEEGEDEGPYGAKSIGEIATVPAAAAVVNAVNDALDTELSQLPLTPARIIGELHK